MGKTVTNIIEMILGAVLISLSLIYLISQYFALQSLIDIISQDIINDSGIYQQYSLVDMVQVSDEELCATIMGYREYPIMVDENLILANEYDYKKILEYVKAGQYTKEYNYDDDRKIIMIRYSYLDL